MTSSFSSIVLCQFLSRTLSNMTSSLTSVVLCQFLLTIDDTALEIFLSLIITTVNILPNETSRKRKEKKREATMDNRKVRLTNRVCGSCEILHLWRFWCVDCSFGGRCFNFKKAILACRTRRNFSSSSPSSELDHSLCYVCVCLSPTKRNSRALQKTLGNITRSCQSAHTTATFSTATRRLCPFKMKFQCLCFGEISPNFDLKKMISTYTKDFSWKKKTQNRQISKKKM